MNPEQARTLIRNTFTRKFEKEMFRNFINELLNGFDESKSRAMAVPDAFASHIRSCSRLGTYESPDGELADVLIVNTTQAWKLERTRSALRDFVAHKLKRGDNYKEAGLVAFVAPDAQTWRFSFVRMEYQAKRNPETGKIAVEERLTPARRFSYIVGETENCHTAQTRFLGLLQDTVNRPALATIEDAFSVERVTKEFFEQYKALYLDLKDELDRLAQEDKIIGAEFADKNVSTADFAKKLMGQIVFLYFLQKKGWLGVPKGGQWGDGPHNFMRQLFEGRFSAYDNFFNDILEPLFYSTLAEDRGHDAWCKIFNCRIPFLNGGLFEPVRGYDWKKTDIIIPNTLFSNTNSTKAGDIGTGILDVFDRFNFTVNEAEPLEKDVAIDPEMLGKVFENLLEVKERKSKGSFYTPREIVHYMCQESLINYLDTAVNVAEESIAPGKPHQGGLFGDVEPEQTLLTSTVRHDVVPRADIETLIHLGEQGVHYETIRIEKDKGSQSRKLPESIEKNARLLDEKLADIAVCDPAIGSGAFPVGMMQEIVRARSALTPYFNDVNDRTPYHFKRHAIQKCLYGVDIDPGAVEIAKLRLWLSLVVDEDDVKRIKPLPNLDYKIVAGNSLIGVEHNLFNTDLFGQLERLKPLHFDATDHKKRDEYRQKIDGLIGQLTNGKKAFDFMIYFSEVFHRNGGFDVVIGNPPYVRPHKLSDQFKKELWSRFESFEKKADLYVCFIEKGIKLLRMGGSFAYIVSNGCLRLDSFESLRKFLLNNATIRTIIDFDADVFDSAAVKTCVLVMERGIVSSSIVNTAVVSAAHELENLALRRIPQSKFIQNYKHIFDLSSETRTDGVKAKMRNGSIPLGQAFDVSFGLKTGDDSKFLSCELKTKQHRPLLRGEDVGRYTTRFKGEYVWYVPDKMRAHRQTARPGTSARFEQPKVLIRDTGGGLRGTFDGEEYYVKDVLIVSHSSQSSDLLKRLIGVLNSTLMSFYYDTSFPTLHVQRDELASLPIKQGLFGRNSQDKIPNLVDRILSEKRRDAGADVSALEREIDELVYGLYGLTPDEIKLVEEATR